MFFFKQKTAYEMRISDWSSDVCSSDLGGDAIEEPAVVRDDEHAAGELGDRFFQRAQGVDVEIVGRLVEQQHVGAFLQHLGKVHAVALAARELADLLLLVAAPEVEGADIGARLSLVLAELNDVEPAGDFLPPRDR